MTIDQAIQKAALLLDLKADRGAAEAVLSKALSGSPSPSPSFFQAKVMLASLIAESRAEEARQHLEGALAVYSTEWDDVVERELVEARALLAQVS